MQAWERIAQPLLATFAAQGDTQRSRRIATLSCIAVLVISGFFGWAIWVGWGPLQTYIFKGGYPSIESVVMLWFGAAVTRLICEVYSMQLQALALFRELSVTGIAGSIATVIVLAIVVTAAPFQWAILAIVFGNLVDLAYMLVVLRGLPKRKRLTFRSR
jgi:O-antigen/teichoic acid export membrane protein